MMAKAVLRQSKPGVGIASIKREQAKATRFSTDTESVTKNPRYGIPKKP
jgi:hypothetical protein